MAKKPQPVTEIYRVYVTDPVPHPSKNFTMYKVHIEIQPVSVDGKVEVKEFYKRFSDFRKLQDTLGHYYRQLYRAEAFPSLPSPGFLKRVDPAMIEQRRTAAELMLQFIYERDYLYNHALFKEFCSTSCDTDVPP
ncbi:hypothetical protein CRM22_003731 [Opisthorchis felineus]|uniref:PX domain-containing protein n=1 Tax=Opisthorchis felineus TaxID=147828 RepID=A0A4S2LZW8_OPIFE|nr:hypothetical protein CRM22_003731 [Opisthorchis felineus]